MLLSQSDTSLIIYHQAIKSNYDIAMSLDEGTSSQVDSIVALSINYSFTNKDSCLTLGQKSIQLGKKLTDKNIYANALLELGDSYRIYGDSEKASELLLKGKELYESLGNKGQIAYACNKLGALYSGQGENDLALKQYIKALELWEELKDTANIFKPTLNIAWIFYRLNQNYKAQTYNNRALELAKAVKDKRSIGYALNNRGIYLTALGKYYRLKADTVAEMKQLYSDSAEYYEGQIIENYEESLSLAKSIDDRRSVMRVLVNLAKAYSNRGSYNEALKLGKEAEKLENEIGDVNLIIMNSVNLSDAYRNLGKGKMSEKYGLKALELASNNKMSAQITAAHNELHKTYKMLGRFKDALVSHEAINTYILKTSEENTTKVIADAEARYQNVKKQNEILDQRNEILSLENRNSKIKKQRNSILGIGLIVLIVGFFISKLNKLRKDRNDKKAFAEALIFAQEQERKRIAQDLHDGIGQTLLMIKKQMDSSLDTSLENQKMISETLDEVRSISHDLHPFQLEKFGLLTAVKDMMEKFTRVSDVFMTNDIDLGEHKLTDKQEINIYRVIQEALSNIIKHSEATAAKVEMSIVNNILTCQIMDNGKGFDHEVTLAKSKSLGLKTMFERIATLNGKFKMKPNSEKGTVVEFSVPV